MSKLAESNALSLFPVVTVRSISSIYVGWGWLQISIVVVFAVSLDNGAGDLKRTRGSRGQDVGCKSHEQSVLCLDAQGVLQLNTHQ